MVMQIRKFHSGFSHFVFGFAKNHTLGILIDNFDHKSALQINSRGPCQLESWSIIQRMSASSVIGSALALATCMMASVLPFSF